MTPTPSRTPRNLAGLVGWFVLLGVAIALFTGLDDPRLATPAITDLSAWGDWAASTDPIFTTIAILRLVLIGLTWYLLGASTIQVVARLTRSMAMLRVANAISVPLVRRVVSTTLGMGLAASMVTGASGTATTGPAPPPRDAHVATAALDDPAPATAPQGPTMAAGPSMSHADAQAPSMDHTDPSGPDTGITMQVDLAQPVDAPTMRHADDPQPDSPQPVGRAAATAVAGMPRLAVSGAPATSSHGWTVASGDHLWHIAETVMGDHLGHPADDTEITSYWLRLIEANRDCLPDPNNPDLIVPGLELELPNPDPGTT